MGRAIFISYRRDDTEGEAGRLFDDLVGKFGEDSVFMDVAGINPGVDFRKAIDDNVASCGVLLAMIGPAWCSIKNADGTRRLDDPNDFVRLEIASALARDVAVIPVLVHDAKMPRPTDLPENLKNLAFRNSVEITHARWNSDVQLLTAALGRYVAPAAATDTAPVHATVAVQLPPPTAPARKERSSRPSSMPLILGIVAAAVVALGAVAFFMLRGCGTPSNSAFVGTWTNSAPLGNNWIKRLEISSNGDQLSIHAWGNCEPSDCDWGTQTATPDEHNQAKATWNLPANLPDGGLTAEIAITEANGQLTASVSRTYARNAPSQREWLFVKSK